MDYRPLGRTGVSVSQLCLGAMMFGAFGNSDHDDAVRIIHKALDAGINFIDTADGYSAGESEEILGKALAGGRRDTSCSPSRPAFRFGTRTPTIVERHGGGSPRRSRARCAGCRPTGSTSTRLAFPIRTPISTKPSAPCPTSCTPGKIRSFGASKVPASQIVEAQWTADRRGHGRFRTEQPPYSMLTRAIEYDVLPTCLRHGMGVMSYSPLAGGWLSGKYRKGQEVSGPGSAARGTAVPRSL